ncbi:MAG: bifunctional DNA-formamidopyrimidine glycosylase/DNA-(apurinic or apyrimidinic site) lyase [Candidatus Paceibacterota bacterium]|jgi:formamidopyrimidine-DNA glycosylase
MPELPEVQTTVNGLKKTIVGLKITDVWTDLAVKNPTRKDYYDTIKSSAFFTTFKKKVVGAKVISAERRAKNILINLSSGNTILIHLKMTGHLLFGLYEYDKNKNVWSPSAKEKNQALRDPYNRFVHVVFSFSNNPKSKDRASKHLAFCDTRKFGKVTLVDTKTAHETSHLQKIGPEPFDKNFTVKVLRERLLKRPMWNTKTALMNQEIVAGIGNIYSDELLWLAGIHPEQKVKTLKKKDFKKIFDSALSVLTKGIDFGGDSMSDYRNIHGERGEFQHTHNAYRKTGSKCSKRGCEGIITRKVIDGRSAHFCPLHQKLFKE